MPKASKITKQKVSDQPLLTGHEHDVEEPTLFGLRLWQQVIIGLILGILAGMYLKEDAAALKTLGTIFITLIKMVVAPLIFLALVSGITSMSDSQNFARVGLKGVFAYFMTCAFAVVIGIAAGLIFQPGHGVTVDLASLGGTITNPTHTPSMGEFLLSLIPHNAIAAMAEDHYLQVVVFSIFTGITINLLGKKVEKAKEILHEFAYIAFKMIEIIVRLAPLAVFGFMAWMVGTQGLEIIETLAWLIIAVVSACIFQYFVFGVLIAVFGRVSPLPFYRKMINTQVMAFSTSSSKATLTTAMREISKMGVSESSTKFVLPLGACVNMDGTAIYLAICALFFAQMFGVELQMHDYLVLILTCTLGSMGAAGIPSGSIIFMGMVLGSVGLPMEGIALILGVDRILDMVRTTINITGDCAITLVIDSSEKTLDEKKYYS